LLPGKGQPSNGASKDFLADQEDEAAKSTVRMYRYLMNSLKKFANEKGYIHIDQLERASVAAFEQTWQVGSNTARKNLANLKTFFEYCIDQGWIENNPARGRKRRKTRKSRKEPERIPFSDEELERTFHACENKYGKTGHANRYRWNGQDLADFIAVSVYTGLRISDVSTFHADRLLESGECQIRATKNGKKVYTWIPTWLQERIHARAREFGPLIFGEHETEDIESITDQWRRKLKRLWGLCGPWSVPPTHHRFRHTFARILLQQGGVSIRDVAELLGDTEETVRKHYAAWVPELQERITKVLKKAFEDKPRPNVLKFRSRET
jgi:integrase